MLELAERHRDRTWVSRTLQRVLTGSVARGDWKSAREVCRRYSFGLSIPVTTFIDLMVGDVDFGDLSIDLGRKESNLPGTFVHMLAVVARVTVDSSVLALAESNAVNLLNADQQLPQWQTAANLSLAIVAVERGDKDTA